MVRSAGTAQPRASRPYMPGYGLPEDTKGLLPWRWAAGQLTRSHNYWLVTARTTGAPHAMPLWGVWLQDRFWFSTGARSRKARNLAANPKCVVCTEHADKAVILEGKAQRIQPPAIPRQVAAAYKAKYGWKLDPKLGPVFAVQPRVAFGLVERDMMSTATRWHF